ncbi:hypothetical protein IJG04_03340 [Candidatus Saccharibacteria bacterium]|nr:hypothetical protein [Candidatus Saccharibacteria bacterium]
MSRANDNRNSNPRRNGSDVYGRLPQQMHSVERDILGEELSRAIFTGFAFMQASAGGTTPTAEALSKNVSIMEEAHGKPSTVDTKKLRREITSIYGHIGEDLTKSELAEVRAKAKPGDNATELEYEEVGALLFTIPKTTDAKQLEELRDLLKKLEHDVLGGN